MQNHIVDPRSRSGFRPKYYPTANGNAAPPIHSVGRNERITLEFLAAYYDLNCQYSRLLEVRTAAVSSERTRAEQESLLTVERLLIIRDELEDRYAPLGVIAEPVVQGGFTVDLKLSFGNVDATGRPRSGLFTITANVPIPLPERAKPAEPARQTEVPAINAA